MAAVGKLASKPSMWLLLVVMLVFASCVAGSADLAALEVTPKTGRPGATLEVRGERFSAAADAGEVHLRWDEADGPVMATVSPDPSGEFTTTVSTPGDAEEGFHMLVATQRIAGDDGEMEAVFGTPARASVTLHEPGPGERPPAPSPEAASPRRGAGDVPRPPAPSYAVAGLGGRQRAHHHPQRAAE